MARSERLLPRDRRRKEKKKESDGGAVHRNERPKKGYADGISSGHKLLPPRRMEKKKKKKKKNLPDSLQGKKKKKQAFGPTSLAVSGFERRKEEGKRTELPTLITAQLDSKSPRLTAERKKGTDPEFGKRKSSRYAEGGEEGASASAFPLTSQETALRESSAKLHWTGRRKRKGEKGRRHPLATRGGAGSKALTLRARIVTPSMAQEGRGEGESSNKSAPLPAAVGKGVGVPSGGPLRVVEERGGGGAQRPLVLFKQEKKPNRPGSLEGHGAFVA